MEKIRIEQIGGLAGLGDSSSALTRMCELNADALKPEHRRLINRLFERPETVSPVGGDQITFKISRDISGKPETIVVNENDLPTSLQEKLQLQFR